MEKLPGNAGNPGPAHGERSGSISAHRPNGIQLPDDPREAAAGAIALLRGQTAMNRAAAAEALILRLHQLSSSGDAGTRAELIAHLPVLEALFLRFAGEAGRTEKAEHAAIFVKIALAAQQACARTVALLHGLRLQEAGAAQVLPLPDSVS
jgi:hypothetical protein